MLRIVGACNPWSILLYKSILLEQKSQRVKRYESIGQIGQSADGVTRAVFSGQIFLEEIIREHEERTLRLANLARDRFVAEDRRDNAALLALDNEVAEKKRIFHFKTTPIS